MSRQLQGDQYIDLCMEDGGDDSDLFTYHIVERDQSCRCTLKLPMALLSASAHFSPPTFKMGGATWYTVSKPFDLHHANLNVKLQPRLRLGALVQLGCTIVNAEYPEESIKTDKTVTFRMDRNSVAQQSIDADDVLNESYSFEFADDCFKLKIAIDLTSEVTRDRNQNNGSRAAAQTSNSNNRSRQNVQNAQRASSSLSPLAYYIENEESNGTFDESSVGYINESYYGFREREEYDSSDGWGDVLPNDYLVEAIRSALQELRICDQVLTPTTSNPVQNQPSETSAMIFCKLLDPQKKEIRDIGVVGIDKKSTCAQLICDEICAKRSEIDNRSCAFFSFCIEGGTTEVRLIKEMHQSIEQVSKTDSTIFIHACSQNGLFPKAIVIVRPLGEGSFSVTEQAVLEEISEALRHQFIQSGFEPGHGTNRLHSQVREEMCVICQVQPQTSGVLHKNEVHIFACEECVWKLKKNNMRCPICMARVDDIVARYY